MAAFEGSEGLGIEGLAPCQRVTLEKAESFGMAGHGRVSWLDVQFHWFLGCKVNRLEHIPGHGVDSSG